MSERNLREALAFAQSVIKSGESWTSKCEEVIGGALGAPLDSEVVSWILKTTDLRSAIRELMERSWEGGLDDEEVQGILERNGFLVTVPADYNTMMEHETSTMLGLEWETVQLHEAPGRELMSAEEFRTSGLHCRWCGVPSDMHDTPPCITRLKTETYQEVLDEGGVWNPDDSTWEIPDPDSPDE